MELAVPFSTQFSPLVLRPTDLRAVVSSLPQMSYQAELNPPIRVEYAVVAVFQ